MRFVDLLRADGLYITQNFLTRCRRLGLHVLVKTSEESLLNVLEDARSIFDSPQMADALERVSGVDADRHVAYEVWAAGGLHHTGYAGPLKVARGVERSLKPRKGRAASETFWVICTDESLSAGDLRELAHRRWSVENNRFKMLNEQMNSKPNWTRGARSRQTFEVRMLSMFLSFGMLKAFEQLLDEAQLWERFKLRQVPLGFGADVDGGRGAGGASEPHRIGLLVARGGTSFNQAAGSCAVAQPLCPRGPSRPSPSPPPAPPATSDRHRSNFWASPGAPALAPSQRSQPGARASGDQHNR